MSSDLRICLYGATGKMGREILKVVVGAEDGRSGSRDIVVAGVASEGSAKIEEWTRQWQLALGTKWFKKCEDCNVVIDFSSPVGTRDAVRAAKDFGKPIVIGTTGLSEDTRAAITEASKTIPILLSSNFSVGMNVLFLLAGRAVKMLGSGVDVEIVELHHKMKKDAPSGTALTLGDEILRAMEPSRGSAVITASRSGKEALRKENEICMHAVRGGDVVGEHTAYFFANGERLELTHRATNRAIFARGAVRAAKWLVKQAPGSYSMRDVLENVD